jgi:sterol carrier protein 2
MGLSTSLMEETRGKFDTPRNAQYFANAGREYMEKYVDLVFWKKNAMN